VGCETRAATPDCELVLVAAQQVGVQPMRGIEEGYTLRWLSATGSEPSWVLCAAPLRPPAMAPFRAERAVRHGASGS
jgi:hypothetical protein